MFIIRRKFGYSAIFVTVIMDLLPKFVLLNIKNIRFEAAAFSSVVKVQPIEHLLSFTSKNNSASQFFLCLSFV